MSLLDMLVSENSGPAIGALAQKFDLDPSQVSGALGELVPALAQGIGSNAAQPGGLENLMKALQSGQHGDFLDSPYKLEEGATVDEGNAILGHILGSKDASRAVAKNAASNTGLSDELLKKMLPIVATMVMGALSKKTSNSSGGGNILGDLLGGSGGPDLGALGSILGVDSKSAGGGLAGLAAKILKG